jgi:hypothetical protein
MFRTTVGMLPQFSNSHFIVRNPGLLSTTPEMSDLHQFIQVMSVTVALILASRMFHT